MTLGEVARRSRADLGVVAAVLAWVPLVLALDTMATLGGQRLLGLGTWVLLLGLLVRERPLVRAQVAVVVVLATAVEYTFSPLLEVYLYRLENVPAYVPPGHGLVYLCALAFGRAALTQRWRHPVVALVVLGGGVWASYGVVFADRVDALGLFWFLCLLGFLRWGPSPLLYAGAFVVVSYLEILGTWWGTWEWALRDPTGIVTIGNPPSGAAGGYGWFDLWAVLTAPYVLSRLGSSRRGRGRPRPAGPEVPEPPCAAARWSPPHSRRPVRDAPPGR